MSKTIKFDHLIIAVALLYVVCIFTPYIGRYLLILPILFGALFLLLTFERFISCLRSNPLLIGALLLTAICFFYKLIGVSSASIGNYAKIINSFFSLWIGVYYLNFGSERKKILLFRAILLVSSISIVENIVFLINNPSFSSTAWLVGDIHYDSGSVYTNKTNFGDTSWQYAIGILCFSSLVACFKKKLYLIETLSFFILSFTFLLIYSTSTTLFITLIISILLSFLLLIVKNRTLRTIYLGLFVLLFFAFVVVGFNEDLYSAFSSLLNEKMRGRMDVLISFLTGKIGADDNATLLRFTLFRIDFKTWINNLPNFVFGVGYHMEMGAFQFNVLGHSLYYGVGNHSGLIDLLPKYGLFGFVFGLWLALAYFYFLKHSNKQKIDNPIVFVIYLYILFNFIFNTLFYGEVVLSMALIIPLVFSIERRDATSIYERTYFFNRA